MGRIVAPKHLSSRSKAIYRTVMEDYRLDREPVATRVLCLALEASDRAEEARSVLAAEGVIYRNRFGEPRAHPMVAVERDARIAVARLFRELSLDEGGYAEPRIPRTNGAVS
jgi:phage terminase small subunit